MPSELDVLLSRSRELGIRPNIGVRAKLSVKASGHWTDSGGERSTFGLSPAQIVDVVDKLKACDMLDCFRLLHYHLGSQVSNIRDIRTGVMEGARLYVGLVQEGAPMGYLDLGGGLAVDYDGSHTNYISSRNYNLDEYSADIVEAIMSILDEQQVPHPHIITESGRATVAYYSVLLFNVLDVSAVEEAQLPAELPDCTHVWHVFAVRCADRNALEKHLNARGIGTNKHYPTPIHLQGAYAELGLGRGALPLAEEISATERKFFDKRRNAVPCALAKTVGNLPVFAYENVPYLYVARMLDRVFVLLHQIFVFGFPHRSDKHVFHKISPSKIYHLRTYMSMPIINEKTPPLHYVASITLQKKRKQQELYE